MDGVAACPWGVLSVVGTLAVLVVAPSQCVEAAGAADGSRHGGRRRPGGGPTLLWLVRGCHWIELGLAFGVVAFAIGGIFWTGMHRGGSSCLWVHLLTRLATGLLLLVPAIATAIAWQRVGPFKSAWGPYALCGMAMLLLAGGGRLYGEKGSAAWSERDPGSLLEAGFMGVLALLAMAKAGGAAAMASMAANNEPKPRARRKSGRWRWDAKVAATEGSLEAALLSSSEEAADEEGAAGGSARKEAATTTAPSAPLDRAGWWSRLAFGWVGPLLRTGASRQLVLGDVPALAEDDGTARWSQRFDAALEAEQGRPKPSLLRAARRTFGADFYVFAGLQLLNDLLAFAGPVLLKLIVTYVHDFAAGAATLARGYGILAVLLLTYAASAVLATQYSLRMARLQLRVRTALVAAVYARVLRCRAPQLAGLGSGGVTNLISLDVQRVQDAASSFNSFWSLPVQVALTLYFLYREVSYAFIAGLSIMVLMVPLNVAIANAITRVTQRQMRFKDQRVQTCDEMLHGIQTLKVLAWEGHLAAAIGRLREEEMACLARRKYLDALCVIFWATAPVLTSLATFVAVVYIDHEITPAAVFTTIALLQMLTFPLNAFPWILNGLMEARVSKRRLQRFLLELPSPPTYVLCPDACPQSPTRRHLTVEGIFRNTGLETGAARNGKDRAPFCLEVYGSFSWEAPPSSPPPPPVSPLLRLDDEPDGVSPWRLPPRLPERVVDVDELQEGEGLLPPDVGPTDARVAMDDEEKKEEEESKGQKEQAAATERRGFVLRDLHLRVGQGEIVGVYGKIGSGKSSLLEAILGEMYAEPLRGCDGQEEGSSRVVMRAARVAYVAQSPWLQRGSIRENIVFGHPWDASRFGAVVAACGLDEDLAALPAGADTELGERGGTLSGGQRLRVALARALYSRAELYLLDDPFSGLDGRTAAHVAREAVYGLMRRENATVVLVSHALPLLADCDWAVAMRGGRVVERIRFRHPQKRHGGQQATAATPSPRASASSLDADLPSSVPKPDPLLDCKKERSGRTKAGATRAAGVAALATEETREEGKVRWDVHSYYLSSAGRLLSVVTIVSLLAMQLSSNAMSLWLSVWSAHTERYSPAQFLSIAGAIAGSNAVFTILRSFLFAWGGLRAAKRLHDRLLAAILAATLAFFQANPVGRILNRFAGDTWTVDDSLPFILNIFLAQSAALVGTAAVLVLASPWALLVLLLVAPLYYRLQAFYRSSSRELKRLDSVARSPLLTHFSDTMDGAVTVRAFGAAGRFQARSLALVDDNQRVAFYSSAASQWLALRIQAFGVVVVASVAAWAVGSCAAHRPARAELVGLALSYASGVLGNLGGILSSYTETEREMVAVERVQEFTEQQPEPAVAVPPALEVASDWPAAGAIRVEKLCLRYRPGWPLALDHLSLRVEAGERIALCGRTGSGKSSLLACLFRLVPWEGAILIDGVPIDRVPLRRLRSALAIVPQQPTLFAGTVRSNVDPGGNCSDAELFGALQACHLDAVLREHFQHQQQPTQQRHEAAAAAPVPSLAQCLNMEVNDKGANFSVGQRQLICLCRVLLQRARVVCIDEATASLDPGTDALVRRTIAHAFAKATLITVAHRMSTVLGLCTRVLVLSEGRLVEEGDPHALLADPTSHLHALSRAEESGDAPTE